MTTGAPGRARLILVFVVDGLRPDAINPDDTPVLSKLRREGGDHRYIDKSWRVR